MSNKPQLPPIESPPRLLSGDLCATVQEIRQLAVDAAGAQSQVHCLALPGSDGRRHLLATLETEQGDDGQPVRLLKTREIASNTPRRQHELHSVGEVARFCSYAAGDLSGRPVVFVGEHRVVIVIDDRPESYRENRADVVFQRTPEHELLDNLARQMFSQKQLIRLLRVELAECATASSQQLLATSRRIVATTSSKASGEVRNGKESIGRDIEAEILSSAGEIAEEVEFSLRLFTDPELQRRHTITCAVEWDPATLTCQICPRPGDLRRAVEEELSALYTRLEGDCECPIFLGSP